MKTIKDIDIKVIAAASYFAHVSQRIGDIAEAFEVDDRTVRRWAAHPLWNIALDTIGYTGSRTFETEAKRCTRAGRTL